MKSATVGSWQARYRYKESLKKLPRRRQQSIQLPGTRPKRSTGPPQSRPCLSASRLHWRMLPRRESGRRVTRGRQNRSKRRNASNFPRSQKTQIRQKKTLRPMTTASRISRLLLETANPNLLPSLTQPSSPSQARNALQPKKLNSRLEAKACPFQLESQTEVSGTIGQRDSVGRQPQDPLVDWKHQIALVLYRLIFKPLKNNSCWKKAGA